MEPMKKFDAEHATPVGSEEPQPEQCTTFFDAPTSGGYRSQEFRAFPEGGSQSNGYTGAAPSSKEHVATSPKSAVPGESSCDDTFPVFSPAELEARQANISWLVKPIISDGALSMVYGDSGVGKSFMALDLACRMSLGMDWFGHRVRSGVVLYVAAEGKSGVNLRLKAFARHHGMKTADLKVFVVGHPLNLLTRDWRKLADTVHGLQEREGPMAQVFIDTLSAVTVGADENSSDDMSRLVSNLRSLIENTGVGVTVVHHIGKDARRGARGHSSLRGACDSIIHLSRNSRSEDVRKLKLIKSRESEDGLEWFGALHDVDLEVDEEGAMRKSKVFVAVDTAGAVVEKKQLPKFSEWQHCVMIAVELLEDELGRAPFDDVVWTAAQTYRPKSRKSPLVEKRNTDRQDVRRACRALEGRGILKLMLSSLGTIEFIERCDKSAET